MRELEDGCFNCGVSTVLCHCLKSLIAAQPCCLLCDHRTPTDSPHPETTPMPRTASSESYRPTGQRVSGLVQP